MAALVISREDVVQRLTSAEAQIRSLGVQRLAVFGSFVRDDAGAESDVDLLIEFTPGHKTYDNLLALSELVEQLLQRPVDVVTREGLSPYIGPHVLAEAVDVIRPA